MKQTVKFTNATGVRDAFLLCYSCDQFGIQVDVAHPASHTRMKGGELTCSGSGYTSVLTASPLLCLPVCSDPILGVRRGIETPQRP